MAPEVLMGERADARSDVWSLGVVLFELMAAQVPFEGDEPHVVWMSILQDVAPRLDERRPHVPRKVADVVARCLAKDPAARYTNATELGAALAALMVKRARPPFVVALACVVLVAIGVIAGAHMHRTPTVLVQSSVR
jgi:serine/threonine-protein kinase